MIIKNNSYHSHGISFCGLLTILFIGLKLTEYIDWSWWLITLPLWGVFAACLVRLFICLVLLIGPEIFRKKGR